MEDTPQKRHYESPTILRHQVGQMNKFGQAGARAPFTHIDGVAVDDLIGEYGSPLFVFSEKTIASRYNELYDAFALRYPRVKLTWSYKTNYLGGICRLFHRLGAAAEIVSDFEYEKALHNGVAPDNIHFNGPMKPRSILEKCLPAGTTIIIDHFDEMLLAERISVNKDINPKVGLRINLVAEGIPAWNRFGFNYESGQAWNAARRLISRGVLQLTGIHCHIGTFLQEPGAYRQAATKMATFANDLREKLGIELEFIDLGGGIASHNTLITQYLPGEQATPPISRFAEAIVDGLQTLTYPPAELPTLVLENGRTLVDEAGFLVTTVLANKRLPDGRRAVIIDAGVNLLFTAYWFKHDIVPTRTLSGLPEPTIFYGPLCMTIDVIRDNMLFPPLEVGDKLVLKNVGAYSVTQWQQFITYRPAVALVGENKKHALLRRRENLQSIVSHEDVPEWLR
jgi:diaminopimelate decarboxylase